MVRARWGAATSEEESRAYFQARLTVLYKYMFWVFAALLAFLKAMYTAFPTIEPEYNRWVYVVAGVAIALMAFQWRRVLVRAKQNAARLRRLDAFYTIGVGVVFAAAALIAYDFRPAAYTCLMYQCFAQLTRALIVPSTGRRTAILTSLAFVPTTITAAALALWTDQEVHGPAFFGGYMVVTLVTVLLAWTGSQIIYGLRREANAAKQLGQYRLVRRIGSGGLGEVFLADHVTLRRPAALKLLRPDRVGAENVARFEHEVQLTSELTHPNTVAVFDYGRSAGGVFYYAMEYLGGGIDLRKLVRDHGIQPSARVVQILAQVCGALQEAHDTGFIHRDIKPANIMLCERGGMPDVAKVVDFGLVKKLTAETGDSQQIIMGTPDYLAPEAITEPSTIGPPADLYALGCVGYFLLTGRRVFEGKTTVDVCIQHATATPRPLGDHVPEALAAVILKCLAKAPADRYPSATALAEALAAVPVTDWSDAQARAWWREFRPNDNDLPGESLSTMTIPVDLAERAEVTP
jgi:serine/threonine-protein kinase